MSKILLCQLVLKYQNIYFIGTYFPWVLVYSSNMENVILRVCESAKIDEIKLAHYLQVDLSDIEKWKRNPWRIPIDIMQRIGNLYAGTLDYLVYGKDPIDISQLTRENRVKLLSFYFKEDDEGFAQYSTQNKRKSVAHGFDPDNGYLETSCFYRMKDMRANEMKISQSEYGYRIGYSRSMVKFWEEGEKGRTLGTVLNACRVLRGSLDYIIMDNRPRSLFTEDLDEELIENIKYNVKRLEDKKPQCIYEYD